MPANTSKIRNLRSDLKVLQKLYAVINLYSKNIYLLLSSSQNTNGIPPKICIIFCLSTRFY